MTIKIGVIGCGGRIHGLLNMWQRLGQEVEITALCDPRAEAIERYRTSFHCPQAAGYTDYQELLRHDEIAWVIIGSVNAVHAEQCIAAFQAGKDVFCEKPIAVTLEQCRDLKAAQLESGRQLMVGFTLRYTPHYNKIKELLNDGVVGDIISLEFNETLPFNHGGFIAADWRRLNKFGGSHILEKCSHDVDICNWMVASRAARVASFGGLDFFTPENRHHQDRIGPNAEGKEAYCSWPRGTDVNPFTGDRDIVDNQVCIVEFENKVRATFHTNLNAGIPERRIYILGTEGAIRADLITGTIETARIGWDSQIETHTGEHKGGHGGGDQILVEHLYKMMAAGAPSLTSLDAGIDAAVTCFGFQDAMDQGCVVDMQQYWKVLEDIPLGQNV